MNDPIAVVYDHLLNCAGLTGGATLARGHIYGNGFPYGMPDLLPAVSIELEFSELIHMPAEIDAAIAIIAMADEEMDAFAINSTIADYLHVDKSGFPEASLINFCENQGAGTPRPDPDNTDWQRVESLWLFKIDNT